MTRERKQREREDKTRFGHRAGAANQKPTEVPSGFARRDNRWHMNCNTPAQEGTMANKASLMKMIETIRGYERVTNRRPAPRPPMLYLMQLREQQQPHAPKRVAISTDFQNGPEVPLPIKIRHAKRGQYDLPVVIG